MMVDPAVSQKFIDNVNENGATIYLPKKDILITRIDLKIFPRKNM